MLSSVGGSGSTAESISEEARRQLTRRRFLIGGASVTGAMLATAYAKPIVRTIRPRPAFASYDGSREPPVDCGPGRVVSELGMQITRVPPNLAKDIEVTVGCGTRVLQQIGEVKYRGVFTISNGGAPFPCSEVRLRCVSKQEGDERGREHRITCDVSCDYPLTEADIDTMRFLSDTGEVELSLRGFSTTA